MRIFAGIPFVWIPSGSFLMGSSMTPQEVYDAYGGDIEWYRDEHPRHQVTLTSGFWLGQFEVTQAEWVAVMGANPSNHVGDDLPVEGISWDVGQDFINALNTWGEGRFAYPTEAQWEYACRAGSAAAFTFGDDATTLDDYGWNFNNVPISPSEFTQPVGGKLPNAWNLYDMHGNVWELCWDWYDEGYYAVSPEVDPMGPDTGRYIVLRGGSARTTPVRCRCAFRTHNNPLFPKSDQGLRVMRFYQPSDRDR
ncbi:MAG TPA: formylglycine-generating enzyme family protein [Candidatus Hydrogenedentes bacterium]|nr:formylglycine-generating enzyme family protein [Candidatus Hydrogenedentota bacterium]